MDKGKRIKDKLRENKDKLLFIRISLGKDKNEG